MIDYMNLSENEVTVLRDTEARKDQELRDQQESYDEVVEIYKEINAGLLEACKAMMDAWTKEGSRNLNQLNADMQKAYAQSEVAIAKTEGQSND